MEPTAETNVHIEACSVGTVVAVPGGIRQLPKSALQNPPESTMVFVALTVFA